MTPQTEGPISDLAQLIAQGKISLAALHHMTGVAQESLAALFETVSQQNGFITSAPTLSADESMRVSKLAGLLAYGFDIPDDDRIRAIVESLIAECGLTNENIALLTGIDVDDIRRIADDPHSVSADVKYAFAVRGSFLIIAANQAQPR
jgi:hypothetical protein